MLRILAFLKTFLLLNCLVLGAWTSASAQPSGAHIRSAFNSSRSYYFELSKKDPKVRNLMEWERAASHLLTFAKQYKDPEYTPRALFLLGRLYEHTHHSRKFRTGLSRAVYFYEQVSNEYRGHAVADDALLRLGDLRKDALDDKTAARAAYFEILDIYPDSEVFEKAEARLRAMGALPASASSDIEEEDPPIEVAKAQPIPKSTPKPTPTAKPVSRPKDRSPKAPAAVVTPGVSAEDSGKSEDAAQSSEGTISKILSTVGLGKGEGFFRKSMKRPIIVIDPGHGGKEEGARGVKSVKEKEVVLNIALLLDEMLRERLNAKTVLTRVRDVHVPLADRTRIANENDADLFISIHANASEYKTLKGIETYYLDNTNDKSSLKLAKRENQVVIQEGGADLGFMLSDLIQNAKLGDSISLAHNIQDSLHLTISRYYKNVKNLGVKKAPFFVLVGAHMPCVLVEVAFIDHPTEGRRLITRRYQKLAAAALYEGIRSYLEKRQ